MAYFLQVGGLLSDGLSYDFPAFDGRDFRDRCASAGVDVEPIFDRILGLVEDCDGPYWITPDDCRRLSESGAFSDGPWVVPYPSIHDVFVAGAKDPRGVEIV